MIIIGVDYHPEFQQIALLDQDTGEFQEKRLSHPKEAEQFYRGWAAAGEKVRVGMEASGHARWFERLLAELGFELWVGDAADIQSKRARKQKTDRQDAQLILKLMLKDDFPRIWVPSWENRDLRQLLWHRHRMVQARTRLMNQLQAVAINEGLRCKKKLWRGNGRQQLESFRLAPWASRRRRDLLELLDRSAFGVGSRWPATWDWCRWKSLVAIGAGSGTSPNKEVRCCAFCWWKQPRSRYVVCRSGAASTSEW